MKIMHMKVTQKLFNKITVENVVQTINELVVWHRVSSHGPLINSDTLNKVIGLMT